MFSVALQSQNCQEDRFRVSPTGNKNLADAHVYCGLGNFTVQSDGNHIVMGLNVPYFSKGGEFICKLTATVPATPKPPACDCGWKKQVSTFCIAECLQLLPLHYKFHLFPSS
jgi:hypothetical protein